MLAAACAVGVAGTFAAPIGGKIIYTGLVFDWNFLSWFFSGEMQPRDWSIGNAPDGGQGQGWETENIWYFFKATVESVGL